MMYVPTFDTSVVWMLKTGKPVFNATKEDATGAEDFVIKAVRVHATGSYCTV